MKMKKIIALVSVIALIPTNFTVISVPEVFADGNKAEDICFFEDFEGYEEVSETYTLVDTMNDLYADGWSVATDNQFTERNEEDNNQKFAQIVQDGDNKVLELTTNKALGRMLDPSTQTPSGSYEVSFKLKPVDIGKKQMLFDLSLNSFDDAAAVAKHNILYSYNGIKMGHRTNNINVPLTNVGTAEDVWYDVKCIVNNDAGYYSVELYKEGEFVARRAPINYAGNEKIGFLKLSGFGTTIYVDDVSIQPCERETLIYEDNFDSYSEVKLPATLLTVGSTTTEAMSREGDSFFEGYTPWRALRTFGNSYDLVYDDILGSQVVRLGDDETTESVKESTGLILMPLEGDFLTKESQIKRGKLRLTYKFRHYSSNGYASALDVINSYSYGGKWDYPPQIAIQEAGLGSPAVKGLPYLRTTGSPVKINQSAWYDAELVFDVINDNVTISIKEDASGSEIAHFTHHTNWINPDTAPVFDKINAINFRAITGSAIYIDDVKLEYYITKPEVSGSNIIITDYRGEQVTDKKNVPPALTSIEIPFGCGMSEESTNTSSVTLSDSKGNFVNYSPDYGPDSYTVIPNEILLPGETYTLKVSSTATNIFGLELGDDFECSFNTTSEYPELMALTSVSISELADIMNGANIDAEINYVNSSGAPLKSMPFIAYYGDDMLLATSSVKPDAIGVGETGTKTVSFTVPNPATLDLSKVDKVSVCLWKGFENSAPYCGEIDVTDSADAPASESTGSGSISEPVITYSYNESLLNISGTAEKDSKYMTVQIIKPGNTFEAAEELDSKDADDIVFYRAQIPVTNGVYSLNVRFDSKDNTESQIEEGDYPTAIYVDDKKMNTQSVYLISGTDFENVFKELNDAAANGDFAEFKNILNNKKSALNFNNGLLGDEDLGNEIKPYFDYVKNNPLDAEKENYNSEMFNTYVVITYLNDEKADNIEKEISGLKIKDDVKALCGKVLTTSEKGKYLTGLVSGKDISDPEELEKRINEALILTAAKYGNGYGELKDVLEICGSEIGVKKPVSAAACRALMGMTFKDIDSFKNEYDKYAEQSSSGGSSGGSGGSGGSSGGTGTKKTSIDPVHVAVSDVNNAAPKVTPVTRTFNDIDNYEWAMTPILALADMNIINGIDEDRFEPSRNITREEFAKILVCALGASDYKYSKNVFSDASDGDWFVKYINIAAELGVVKGMGDGTFGVGQNITRQDMAVMLYNALQYRNVKMSDDGFRFDDDGQIADYAKNAVSALHNMGAINGMTETTFEPVGFATRAQAAKIVYSVIEELQR